MKLARNLRFPANAAALVRPAQVAQTRATDVTQMCTVWPTNNQPIFVVAVGGTLLAAIKANEK